EQQTITSNSPERHSGNDPTNIQSGEFPGPVMPIKVSSERRVQRLPQRQPLWHNILW
ncbi:unnamed protein product, partial [Citrullus colocynthis]